MVKEQSGDARNGRNTGIRIDRGTAVVQAVVAKVVQLPSMGVNSRDRKLYIGEVALTWTCIITVIRIVAGNT